LNKKQQPTILQTAEQCRGVSIF